MASDQSISIHSPSSSVVLCTTLYAKVCFFVVCDCDRSSSMIMWYSFEAMRFFSVIFISVWLFSAIAPLSRTFVRRPILPLFQQSSMFYGFRVLFRYNEYGKPVFPFIMKITEQLFHASFYGYVNGDILLSTTLFPLLSILADTRKQIFDTKPFLMAGRVNEVPEFNIDFLSLDGFNRSFEESYAQGKTRNPFSAVHLILLLVYRITSSIPVN